MQHEKNVLQTIFKGNLRIREKIGEIMVTYMKRLRFKIIYNP